MSRVVNADCDMCGSSDTVTHLCTECLEVTQELEAQQRAAQAAQLATARQHVEALVNLYRDEVLYSNSTCPECGAEWYSVGPTDDDGGTPVEMDHADDCRWGGARAWLAANTDKE